MHEKKYQVFISSTYQDLREERRAVQDVVISMGDFPVQMESFPAADEDQFEFIKSLIDTCDYYVLIIAGRYGSVTDDGLSYTHKEFRYAVEKNVPVLVMVHGEPGKIPADKIEESESGRARLKSFISEAETKRLRKPWTNLGELKLAVREALDHAKATKPRVGWVRGDSIASLDVLEELNNIRKENQEIRDSFGTPNIEINIPGLPSPDDIIIISLIPREIIDKFQAKIGTYAEIRASWISLFPKLISNLKIDIYDYTDGQYFAIDYESSCVAIGCSIAADLTSTDTTGFYEISRNSLDRLIDYYIEAGLMTAGNEGRTPFTKAAQKVARRLNIAEAQSSFLVVNGKIAVVDSDEVPF